MRKPKGTTSKTWKLHLKIVEMNKNIVRKRMKNSLYVPGPFDDIIMNQGEYKANRKKHK